MSIIMRRSRFQNAAFPFRRAKVEKGSKSLWSTEFFLGGQIIIPNEIGLQKHCVWISPQKVSFCEQSDLRTEFSLLISKVLIWMLKTSMDRLYLWMLAIMDTMMLSNSFALHHICKQTADIIFVNVNKQLSPLL